MPTKKRGLEEEHEEPPTFEAPGFVGESSVGEEVQIPGRGLTYAIHEKMADGSWETREDSTILNPDGSGSMLAPLHQPLWPLPGRPEEYSSDVDLFNEVREFFQYHEELRDRRNYELVGSWIFTSYRIEEFQTVPYLFFLGPKGTAKSRMLELLASLSYRGWLITHPTVASMFWVINRYCPTLLADNYEFWPKETRNELDGLFNAGYRRGAIVPRRPREGESGPELTIYKVFGLKALAGTREPPDSLGSRCIFIRTSRNKRKRSLGIDKSWAQSLRNKLLAYRFRHFESRDAAADLSQIMNPLARVGELFYAPVQVAPSPDINKTITELALGVYSDQVEETATTVEAEVVRAILALREQVAKERQVSIDNATSDNRLSIQDISQEVNLGRDEKEKLTPRRIGWVTSRLGFKKARMPDAKGTRAIQLDPHLLEDLANNYDVHERLKPADTPQETSERQNVGNEELYPFNPGRLVASDVSGHAEIRSSTSSEPAFPRSVSDVSDNLTIRKGERLADKALPSVDQNNGGLHPPYLDRGPCRICNEVGPRRLGQDGESLICRPCFEKPPEPPEGS